MERSPSPNEPAAEPAAKPAAKPANEPALRQAAADHLFMHASSYRSIAKDLGKRILVEGKGVAVADTQG